MVADAHRRGLMLVLSSPSGAGKSTLSRLLLDSDDNLVLSISVTTRPRRPSEVDGVHYHFIDRRRFAAMREAGELLEWAEVHGNLYATPRAPVEAALAAGATSCSTSTGREPSNSSGPCPTTWSASSSCRRRWRSFRSRLERRAEDKSDVIDQRLANARAEIDHWPEYDYVIVNRDLQDTYGAARRILEAERGMRANAAPRSRRGGRSGTCG